MIVADHSSPLCRDKARCDPWRPPQIGGGVCVETLEVANDFDFNQAPSSPVPGPNNAPSDSPDLLRDSSGLVRAMGH